MLIVVLIIAIAAALALSAYASTEAGMRPQRAAQEVIGALRQARHTAIATGRTCGVEFDTSTNQMRVYETINGNVSTLADSTRPGGVYVVNFNTSPDVAGVTFAASIAGDASNPYRVAFGPLGATSNTGTITLTYGGRSRQVSVPAVGDPE